MYRTVCPKDCRWDDRTDSDHAGTAPEFFLTGSSWGTRSHVRARNFWALDPQSRVITRQRSNRLQRRR